MSAPGSPAQAIEHYLSGPSSTGLGISDDEIDAKGREGGAAGGAAIATACVPCGGPLAAPVGAAIGSFIGGNLRSWAKGAWSGIKGLFSHTAGCVCQLGACADDDDDVIDMVKYNILKSQCKSPEAQALIEKTVIAHIGPDQNEMRICARLAAFAKCRDENWVIPNPEAVAFAKADADCKAKGYAGWNGTNCVAIPQLPKPCPGGERDASGMMHGFRGLDDQCVFCPNGTRRKSTEWLLNDVNFECIPSVSTGVVAQFSALSTPKKVAVGAVAAGGLWVAVRYAMGKALLPL